MDLCVRIREIAAEKPKLQIAFAAYFLARLRVSVTNAIISVLSRFPTLSPSPLDLVLFLFPHLSVPSSPIPSSPIPSARPLLSSFPEPRRRPMDTTASSRPDFADPPPAEPPSFRHSHLSSSQYSQTPYTSQPQPYPPPARQPHLSFPPSSHDPSRQPLPSSSSVSLARSLFPSDSLQKHSPLPRSTLPGPSTFKHLHLDASNKSATIPSRPLHPPPNSQPSPLTRPPELSHPQTQSQERHFPAPAPSFPPPPSALDKKAEPFPFSKSLPYPPAQSTHVSTHQAAHPDPIPASATAATGASSVTHQIPSARTNSSGAQQEQGPLYDIAKLLAAQCTILSGKVYNDKGHNICGVLNQHDKPCKRIGKCPFHGVHKPVTAENSVHGTIDASGTVTTPSTSPDGTNSPPAQAAGLYEHRSPGGSESTPAPGSKPRIPPKQQYKHGWSKDEHFLFLDGLSQHGKGSWKQIASVVKTRTPTQVQSHAQKYFQRQKQTDKNKRSIHDLSLDSPEMIDVAKKFKAGGHRMGITPNLMTDHMPLTPMADPNAIRGGHGVAMAPSALHFAQSGLHSDGVGSNTLNEGAFARFGSNIHGSMNPKFGPGQATSATTLGSSLSSGVHMPQLPGTGQARSTFPPSATNATHQEQLFGSLGHGAMTSGHHRRPIDFNRGPGKLDNLPGRDVILSSVRPAFIPDPYHGNTNANNLPGQQFMGSKQGLYNSQSRTTGGLGAHDMSSSVAVHPGASQTSYPTAGLHGLSGQMGGHPSVFHPPRSKNEQSMPWNYDGDMKPKRPRDSNVIHRDAFHMQNAQLNSTLHGIGGMPMHEHLGSTAGMGNEHQVEQPFDPNQQTQNTSFPNGIFGSNEGVDVNVYGVGGGGPNNPSALGAGISGFSGSTGLSIGQMPLRGQGTFASGNPYNRQGQ